MSRSLYEYTFGYSNLLITIQKLQYTMYQISQLSKFKQLDFSSKNIHYKIPSHQEPSKLSTNIVRKIFANQIFHQ